MDKDEPSLFLPRGGFYFRHMFQGKNLAFSGEGGALAAEL